MRVPDGAGVGADSCVCAPCSSCACATHEGFAAAMGRRREIQRMRRRRATMMTSLCVLICAGVIVAGKPLLRTFGEVFVR